MGFLGRGVIIIAPLVILYFLEKILSYFMEFLRGRVPPELPGYGIRARLPARLPARPPRCSFSKVFEILPGRWNF